MYPGKWSGQKNVLTVDCQENGDAQEDENVQGKANPFSKTFIREAAKRGIAPEVLEEEQLAAEQREKTRLEAEEKSFFDLFGEWFELFYEDVTYIACIKGSTGARNPWNNDEKGIWLDKDNWYDPDYSDNPINLKLAITEGGNVAIRLGASSNNLCCVDLDSDKLIEPFLERLPAFRNTLSRHGSKGRQFYYYDDGEYPQTIQTLVICGSTENGGEFRGAGLSFIWGLHHKKVDVNGKPIFYHWVNKVKPIRYKYADVVKGFASLGWEIKNAHNNDNGTEPSGKKPSSKQSFRHSSNGAHKNGRRIDWDRYNEKAREIVPSLVERWFSDAEWLDDIGEWACKDITGARRENKGAFHIHPDGWCNSFDGSWAKSSIINAIISDYRRELTGFTITIDAVFEGIKEDTGEDFFKPEFEAKADLRSDKSYDVIYNAGAPDYWVPRAEGGWHNYGIEPVRRYLQIEHGLNPTKGKDEVASEINCVLEEAEQHHRVDLAGAYAGYNEAKIYEIGGGLKLLVPRTVPRIRPVQGNWFNLKGFLEGLIPNPLEVAVLRAWIQSSWLSFQRPPGEWGPGQVLVFVGAVGTGKTVLQKHIITPIFGRDADPTSWFTGTSDFNDHLSEAEHWRLSDPRWETRSEKEKFANAFKNAVSESTLSVHPKFQRQRLLEIFKRVTLSMNNEEEIWSIFPLMPASTLEKLIFITTADAPTQFSPSSGNWPMWSATIHQELPAFLYDTVYNFVIPKEASYTITKSPSIAGKLLARLAKSPRHGYTLEPIGTAGRPRYKFTKVIGK